MSCAPVSRLRWSCVRNLTSQSQHRALVSSKFLRTASLSSVSTKMFFPAAERNKRAILDTLARRIEKERRFSVLEPASGTGQHISFFAQHFQNADFQPSEIDPKCIETISENTKNLANVRPPLVLDCSKPVAEWNTPLKSYDVIMCSNMIHIAPFNVCEGFIRGSGQLLNPDGLLFIYGPFAFDGDLGAPSNEQFHKTLVTSNPEWGVRDTTDLKALGAEVGLVLEEAVAMPSNNHTLIFKKAGR